MKPASIHAIAPALLGFLGMAALGWHLAAPSVPVTKPEVASPADTAHGSRHRVRSPRDGGKVAEQMRAVRSGGSPLERMRNTVALANSLPLSEFAAWMEGDRFDFRQGPELDVFRMIIFERWIKEDPDSLIPWADKNNYGQAGRALLFMANHEPQRLIDFYRSNPNDKAELGNLTEVAKKHPALALQRLQELSAGGLSSGATQTARGMLDELAKNSPAALEAALDTLAPDLQREAESTLCRQRLATSFPTEIRALWERPDGWQVFEGILSRSPDLADKLVAEIASLPDAWKASVAENYYNCLNSKNAREWFDADLEGVGFSPSQSKRLRQSALSELASSDPEFALRNLAESGIDPETKENMISTALRSAKGDGAKAEKLINMIGSEEDRRIARDQLKLAELSAANGKAPKPAEWLKTLGSVEGAKNNPYQVLAQLQSWDKAELADLRSRFDGLPVDEKQNIARVVAAGEMNSSSDSAFAGDAIRFLVANPPALPC